MEKYELASCEHEVEDFLCYPDEKLRTEFARSSNGKNLTAESERSLRLDVDNTATELLASTASRRCY